MEIIHIFTHLVKRAVNLVKLLLSCNYRSCGYVARHCSTTLGSQGAGGEPQGGGVGGS
jgi:hypothetical protein